MAVKYKDEEKWFKQVSKYLVEEMGADVDARHSQPLMIAAITGNRWLLEYLVV